MTWWEKHDSAMGLARALTGTEEPSLLSGSAILMLHAAGRRALDAEASAISATRANLPNALHKITDDPLAGCISKSLSDASGKAMYGPFRAAAMKAAADDGAIALVDSLVAAKVPYRDALAASARSYGIAKRDALILARVIKSDPSNRTSVAASQKAMLLWARTAANAEDMMILKAEDRFIRDGVERVVNRDDKGRFARKGAASAAPALSRQEAYDLRMAQRRQRMRERKYTGIPMAQAQEQAQEQALPEVTQRRRQKQAPPRQKQEMTAEQKERQRQAQIEQQELEELKELRELRSIRAARAGSAAQFAQQEKEANIERGYQMINEASKREVQAKIQNSKFDRLMTELRTEQNTKRKREKIAEAADVQAQIVMGLVHNITDGEIGNRFVSASPSDTMYLTHVKFLNPTLTQSINLYVPMMYKPNRELGFMDVPDDDDIFYLYTGKHLPVDPKSKQQKSLMDLTEKDNGFFELLTTADIVKQLHVAEGQAGPKHPLQILSSAFDVAQPQKKHAFTTAVLDQFGGTADPELWTVVKDANGNEYYSMAYEGLTHDLGWMDLTQYTGIHGATMDVVNGKETYIYPTGVFAELDPDYAETSMEEVMEEADAFDASAAMRAYAIFQMTRDGDPDKSNYRNYKFNFQPEFIGFEVDPNQTSDTVFQALLDRQQLDGIDYTHFASPDEIITKDFYGVLDSLGISPSEIEGRAFAIPVLRKTDRGPLADMRDGILNKRTNYVLGGEDRMSDEGQNFSKDYQIAGVKPLWSIGIQNAVKSHAADMEQVESQIRSEGMEIPGNMLMAMAIMRDLENNVINNAGDNGDPKKADTFLDMLGVLTQPVRDLSQ